MFKSKKDFDRYLNLHPVALVILFHMNLYCHNRKLRFQVTSTVSTREEDDSLNRVSSTHREGRAFDLSVKDWSPYDIKEFIDYFDTKFGSEGALGVSGEKRLIVDHVGTARHLHVQIDRSYTILDEIKATFWEDTNESE